MNLKSLDAAETQQLESKFRELLARSLRQNDMQHWVNLVDKLAWELDITHLQCAAALASSNIQIKAFKNNNLPTRINNVDLFVDKPKMVRYRVEVGRNHNATVADIKKMLVDESGVDKKQVGEIQLHAVYSFIDLPEGMPTDIFQHMKTVEINNRPLHMKLMQTGARRRKGSFKGSGRRVNPANKKHLLK